MIRLKNDTEDFLLSVTRNCETLIKQTHRKTEETLEFKLNKPREAFLFNPPIRLEGSWMLGLMGLEVYNSIFNLTEENSKLEHYKFPDEKSGGVSFEKVRDEIQSDFETTDITVTDLQYEITGPTVPDEYRN